MSQVELWTLIGALVFLVIYLFPFLGGPFIQVGSLLWGFIVGRRRRAALIEARVPASSSQSQNQNGDAEKAQSLVDQEFQYLETARKEKVDIVKEKIKEITEMNDSVKQAHQQRKAAMDEGLPAKAMRSVISHVNRETGKNILLFLGIIALLFVDTLIARQIFISLGLFVSENIEFLEHSVQYTTIYGVFLTATLATLLHLVWPRSRFRTFVSKNKWSIIFGAAVLGVFFVVRLLTVLLPDSSRQLMEVLMLGCWIIGVVGVYWLIGEIVGDEDDWFKLLLSVSAPLLVVLLILFGGVVILHGILELLFTKSFEAWFELRRARAVRQERNALEATHGVKRGFYRGFTL